MKSFLTKLLLCLNLSFMIGSCSSDLIPSNPNQFSNSAITSGSVGGNTNNSSSSLNNELDASFNLGEPAPGPILYLGGPVITNLLNVYIIWYGKWNNNPAVPIIQNFIANIDQTNYIKINQGYYQINDDGQINATTSVNLVKSIGISYLHGKNLIDGDVQAIVTDALRAGSLPYDSNGLYFVLLDKETTESSFGGFFCATYCGWHYSDYIDRVNIKFSMVADPFPCLNGCTISSLFDQYGIDQSPNNNWTADGMVSVMIHELEESITDPNVITNPAWNDLNGSESADMCAWLFDPTYLTNSGSRANIKVGDIDYLIQQMWVNDLDGGHCDLHP